MRITKKEFYRRGGLRNAQLYRKQTSDGRWLHFIMLDHYE